MNTLTYFIENNSINLRCIFSDVLPYFAALFLIAAFLFGMTLKEVVTQNKRMKWRIRRYETRVENDAASLFVLRTKLDIMRIKYEELKASVSHTETEPEKNVQP